MHAGIMYVNSCLTLLVGIIVLTLLCKDSAYFVNVLANYYVALVNSEVVLVCNAFWLIR